MLTVATVNVNGIRAAARKGMTDWMAATPAQVLCLQEVRAPDEVVLAQLDGWHVAHQACEIKGRAGVAVASRLPVAAVRVGLPLEGPAHTGRWVETDIAAEGGEVTVVSAYVHTGQVDTVRQEQKYAFLGVMTERLAELAADGRRALVCGDINIAHRNVDIENWRGNLRNAGFLPDERAYLDRWFDELGWVDLGRRLGGEGPGPYTWWSWRGRAFDNDTGWRIDYQLATPALADVARAARVERPADREGRWTDHAPLLVDYDV